MDRALSRRRFLRDATGALALPTILRSGVLAGPGRPGANDRIGLGFIGVGGRGFHHLDVGLSRPRFAVLAVSDVDSRSRGVAVAKAGPGCASILDYREVLDGKDIDAVVISTPDHWHAPIAVSACEAGKDVFCEKPLSLTVRDGRRMADAARRSARVFQTGSQQRSSDEFLRAAAIVRSGRLGKLRGVRVGVWGTSQPCLLPPEPVPDGLDWDRWVGPASWCPYSSQLHPGAWRAFREFSGGTITDWGAHHLDIVQWALDMDASGPVGVSPPEGAAQHVTIEYGSGLRVLCGGDLGVNGVEFEGENGKITVNRGYFEAKPEELAEKPIDPSSVGLLRSTDHFGDWERCLDSRERPICDVEIGHRSSTVCHLVNLALWSLRRVRWDPKTESVVGDPMLARWLDRPMRAPYGI
jgi:predicted dehydrogenase